MVKVHIAHNGTHTGDGQLDDRTNKIGDLVNGLGGFGYLPIDHRVDIDGDVVAGEYGLLRQGDILLAKVDEGRAGPDVRPIYGARRFKERHDNVQAARRDAMKTS